MSESYLEAAATTKKGFNPIELVKKYPLRSALGAAVLAVVGYNVFF